jgi:hypothetical protein
MKMCSKFPGLIKHRPRFLNLNVATASQQQTTCEATSYACLHLSNPRLPKGPATQNAGCRGGQPWRTAIWWHQTECSSPRWTAVSGDARLASPDIALTGKFGSYGQHSDSGVFKNSAFYREYNYGKTILPPKPLLGTIIPVPHVLIGDKGFALQTYLLRPFPRAAIANNARKKKFNKQLSRAWRVVKNAFGILAQKWRVFLGL